MRVPFKAPTGCELLTTLSGSATSGVSSERFTVRTALYLASASGATASNGRCVRAFTHCVLLPPVTAYAPDGAVLRNLYARHCTDYQPIAWPRPSRY